MTLISKSARSRYSCGTSADGKRRTRPAFTSCRSQDSWVWPSGTGKTGMRSRGGVHTSAYDVTRSAISTVESHAPGHLTVPQCAHLAADFR